MHARTRETRRRHIAETRALQEREPSLINLPIPLPVPIASIPVLGPILSPLIDGLPWPTPTSSTPVSTTTAVVSPTTTQAVEPTTTTPAAVPTSTTGSADASSPTGSSGDSSGSSGSSSGSSSVGGEGSSGGDGSSSSSSTGGDVGTGADGSGEGASGSSGVGGSDGVGSAGSAPSSSGGGTDADGGSTAAATSVSSGADPASDAGSHQLTAVSQGAGATSTSASTSSAQLSANFNQQGTSGSASAAALDVSVTSTAVPMGVENAFGGGSSGVASSTGTSGVAATGTTASSSSSQGSGSSGSGPSNSNGGGGSSSSGTSPSTSTSHHGLSRGSIAAIVVVLALLVLITIAALLRRRAIHKRARRRKNWFFGGQTSVYGDSAISSSQYFTDHPNGSAPNMSERSNLRAGAPWETFHDSLAGSTAGSEPPSRIDISVPPVGRQMKGSMQPVWTTHLNGSMVFAPSLATVAASNALPTIRSPDRASWGSVKSNADGSSGEDAAWLSCPESVAVSTRSQGLPSPMSVRPFSPSDLWQFPKPPHDKRRSRPPTRVVSPESVRESSEYATAPENPFGDHASAEAETEADALTAESADTETASHFARVETIRRPFEPALEDEMGVVPGERVRMLQRFPDGWAYAEKVGSRRRGIIPIDCLRTPEEDLPAFLASKRLSSYRPPSVHTKSEETGYSTSGVAI